MKNLYSHFYLYAKHWYKRTDIIDDLKIICGKYCGIDVEFISASNIISILLNVVYLHINRLQDFANFVEDISPAECWKFGGPIDQKLYDYDRAVINKCLSILALTIVRENGKTLIELDEPDETLLPLSKASPSEATLGLK